MASFFYRKWAFYVTSTGINLKLGIIKSVICASKIFLLRVQGALMDIQNVWQNLFSDFVDYLPRLISGIVIFIITLVGSGFVAKWGRKLAEKKISSQEMLQLISLVTRWTIIIVGTVFALDQVNFDVTGFIAGLGVAGFTIGFALQDIAKNFISGLMLLYRQPFNLGEYVRVSDLDGKVKEINVRDTVIETRDGELVIIPNREVFENPIINYTHSQFRRREVKIGLGYEEDAERASDIFLEAIKDVYGVEVEKGITIRAEALGDSSLSMSALFWVDQQTNDIFEVQSSVIKAIKIAAEKEQINLPYPVQTVLVKNLNQ
jgi:small-conductance mechanosensitive channel